MYLTEVSKWRIEWGMLYNTCIPTEFKFVLNKQKVLNVDFVYGLRPWHSCCTPKIEAPESHPCFGQMETISVNAETKGDGVTLVHARGVNGRLDRWMEAIFAVRECGDFWEGKLVLFGRGEWFVGAENRNPWTRFDVVGFRIVEFKHPMLTYNDLSIDEKGNQVIQAHTESLDSLFEKVNMT